jgi:hypothetical protein
MKDCGNNEETRDFHPPTCIKQKKLKIILLAPLFSIKLLMTRYNSELNWILPDVSTLNNFMSHHYCSLYLLSPLSALSLFISDN